MPLIVRQVIILNHGSIIIAKQFGIFNANDDTEYLLSELTHVDSSLPPRFFLKAFHIMKTRDSQRLLPAYVIMSIKFFTANDD